MLEAQGWCEEAIAEERRVAAEMMEPRYIWPENWTTIQVFCRCAWTRIVGPMQLIWDGIAAREIESVMTIMRVPRTEWIDVLDGVRVMVEAARPHLNAERKQDTT